MAVLPINASQREGLHSTPSRMAPEGLNQTFLKGAVLIASAGNLVAAVNNPVVAIVGIAAEAGHNGPAGVRQIGFIPALPHIVFEATMEVAGAGGHILLATDLYAKYALKLNPTGIAAGSWFLDFGETTAACARIIGFRDPVGTTQGRVLFQFLPATTIYGA